jgi:hypothetical protein
MGGDTGRLRSIMVSVMGTFSVLLPPPIPAPDLYLPVTEGRIADTLYTGAIFRIDECAD